VFVEIYHGAEKKIDEVGATSEILLLALQSIIRMQHFADADLPKLVRGALTPDQAERYEHEVRLRIANRRRTLIQVLIAKLDEVLTLKDDQRDKLTTFLGEAWSSDWDRTAFFWQTTAESFPPLPLFVMTEVLDEGQLQQWQSLNKVSDGSLIFYFLNRKSPAFQPAVGEDDELFIR
jgi:hypothetical protein